MIQLTNNISAAKSKRSSLDAQPHIILPDEEEFGNAQRSDDYDDMSSSSHCDRTSHTTAMSSRAAVFLNNACVTLLQRKQFKEAFCVMKSANTVWRTGAMSTPLVNPEAVNDACGAATREEVIHQHIQQAQTYLVSAGATTKRDSTERNFFRIEQISCSLECLTRGTNSLQEQLASSSRGIKTQSNFCLLHPIILECGEQDHFIEECDIVYHTAVLLYNLAIASLCLLQTQATRSRGAMHHKKATKLFALSYAAICKIKFFLPNEDRHFVYDDSSSCNENYYAIELLQTSCIKRTKLIVLQSLGLSMSLVLRSSSSTTTQAQVSGREEMFRVFKNVGMIWNSLHDVNASLKRIGSDCVEALK